MRKTLFIIALIIFVYTVGCEDTTSPFDETVPQFFTLTTNVTPDEGGTVIPSDDTFPADTQIEVEALPSEGWIFIGWEGDLESSRNPESILMDSDKFITSRFLESEFNLNIEVNGNGSVRVEEIQENSKTTDNDVPGKAHDHKTGTIPDTTAENINTSELFTNDDGPSEKFSTHNSTLQAGNNLVKPVRTVRLIAEPSEGWEFVRWEEDLTGNENPAIVEIDRDKTIVAVFQQEGSITFSLSAGIQGEGTVDLNPDKEMYEEAEEVTLTAEPAEGWAFSEWQEDLTGSDNPAILVMDSDKSVTAVFESLTSNLSINVTVQPTNTTAGEVISPAPTVVVTGFENTPLGEIEVTVSELGGLDFDSGTLTVTTNSNGVAEFEDLVINRSGSYRLVFSVDGAGQITSDRFTINSANGDPSQTVADVPENGTAGEPSEITITVEDPFGNGVEEAADGLSISVSGANDINNVSPVKDDGNGVYSASYTPQKTGLDQINIRLNGTQVNGSPFNSTVEPGPAAEFTFNTISSPQTAGESFSITINALDAGGNEATGFSETANLSTTAGIITPESVSFSNGVATQDVSVTQAGAGQTITADNGSINGTSGRFTVEAGPPESIIVITHPGQSTAGQPITGPPTTEITDSFENPVEGVDVTVSLGSGTGFDSGNQTVTTGNDGQALFEDLVINKADRYSLLFNGAGLDVSSNPFEVTSADGEPGQTTARVPNGSVGEPTRITITVEDQFGNRVEGAADNLSVSVSGVNEDAEVEPIIDDGNGVYTTSYTPTTPTFLFFGPDEIIIQLNGEGIKGSPFTSRVFP
ncbi:MAG TPA: filamin/ABP280 repeat domain-containing protein [Balneolaceae bacterium]|nr:filamin/ABP280 repeat domain-containing protein [Balneolaceae bacterium]